MNQPSEYPYTRGSTSSGSSSGVRTVSPEIITRRQRRRRGGPVPSETIDLTITQPPQTQSAGPPPAKRARTTVGQAFYDSSSATHSTTPNSQNLKVEPWPIDDTIEEIDLTEVDSDDKLLAKAQEDLLKSQRTEGQEKPKLADFKCVICLDDPTDLAATPCGHMFCNFCLQGALRAGQPANAKSGRCPVCRRKVNTRDVIPLEIKMFTKLKGKGKGRAG